MRRHPLIYPLWSRPPRMREPEPTAEEVITRLIAMIKRLAEVYMLDPLNDRVARALDGAVYLLGIAQDLAEDGR